MDNISGNISPSGGNVSGLISQSGVKVSGLISQSVLKGLSAYEVAVQNGFQGSQSEWLQSLRGENIQFKSEGLEIYYKYVSDEQWIPLVSIDQFVADYSVLNNKPKINNIELNGNKTLSELGIQAQGDYVENQVGYSMVLNTEIERLSHVDNYDDSEIRQAIETFVSSTVTGVKGVAESSYRTGNIDITPANIGLGNVDNTADENKNVRSAVRDSDGNVIGETYFNGISESGGEVFLTRPNGSSQKLMNAEHTHDASEITSGTIDIARLPAGALERLVDVADINARYALTTATVQIGDTVRQLDTGVMYRVVDDTKLNRAAGYKEYTAGRASAVPWSGIENKPSTFTPSSHTHEISQITDISNASVAQATKLKNPRNISISGGVTAPSIQFDGTGNVALQVSDVDASYLSGTAPIDISGNAGSATKFARERTIEVVGKATASPKVYDGRQNIALEITYLDAAEINHTHTMSDITDLDISSAGQIANFETSNTDNFTDVWFSDPLKTNKPVHNSGIQYNPYRNNLKVGTFQGNLTGNASSASALTVNAGSATQPVYFNNGVPVATSYQLNATVPSNAVFTDTDTHYTSEIVLAGNYNGKTDSSTPLTNGNVYLNHIENNQVTSSHRISGTGSTTVTSDEYGNIIINATGHGFEAGFGISISNSTITNTGVRSISQSSENGNITANINGSATNIPIHGLGTAAYTDASAYATSSHRHSFLDLQNKPTTLSGYGITDAASLSHGHDASDIVSGTIDIARLPSGAMGSFITVENEQERFALSPANVHNGDTVQQEDTGVMYRVIDNTNLNNNSGYKEYTAGAASSVPWTGVTGKPEAFTPSAHTHTISDISNIATASVASAGQLTTARTIAITGAVVGSGSFDGSENLTINTDVNHTHLYAGSSTAGGSATSAIRLDTSLAGSSVVPVYFYEGRPVAMSYQLNASVPADAVFTDTHYTSTTIINSAEDSTSDSSRNISNGNVFLNHVENGVVRSSHRIEGTGSVTVTYNSVGDLIINGAGQDYTHLPNPYSLSINGRTYDGSETIDVGVIDVAHGGTGSSSVDTSPTQNSTRMLTSGGVYTALQGKSDINHTHSYAGSSTVGGSATEAEKLNSSTDAGSVTQPVYFYQGKPVVTTYSLNATVPANAVFTDTHHISKMVVTSTASGTADTTSIINNGSLYVNHIENGEVRSSHNISGTGSVTVQSDSSGNIIINADDTQYSALPNPYSLSINGQDYDGSEAIDVGIIDVLHGGTGNSTADSVPVENSTKFLPSGAIYTALQGKADSNHTHLYAGSSSEGGSATSAIKLDSDAGSLTQPVYFSNGIPVATTYSLGASVPSNAVFTDTHYASKTVVASANDATTDTISSLTNTHVFVNHVENNAVTASHRISGTGATTVTTDASGNIIINSTDTKYTDLPNPYSITIQANGTSLGTYDGSEAKSFNLTYSNIGAAAVSHSHVWSDLTTHPTTLAGYGITDQVAPKTHVHDASEIQSGVFDIARIPVAALERLVTVANQAAMYALTINDVQIGDTVQLEDTGVMYRVIDTSNLDNANGYKQYTAGVAASVPWSGITGKPSEYTPASHSHMYAGSASVGGPATYAETLTSNGGSATQPIYFSGGKPTACTYGLNATVPANAVFTDTHHQAMNVVGSSASATTDTSTSLSNTNVYLNLVENGEVRSSHRILGSDAVTVTTDTSGNIIIAAHDTKPSPIKNPYPLTIKGNGTTLGTYDGDEPIEIDIDYSDVGAAAASHGTHVTYSTSTPSANIAGGSAGSASTVARSDHAHPLQTTISGNAGSANKLNTAITIALSGAVTGSVAFDGSANIEIATTVNHTHNYAGASSSGGPATSANALNINSQIGSTNTPVFFNSSGVPEVITSYGGNAASASKLESAYSLVVGLDSVYSASTNRTEFDGSKNLDGSSINNPTIPITGTLGVENGGTGQTSFTTYGILYGNGSSGISVTPIGNAGFFLKGNGNAAPSWIDPSLVTVGKANTLTTSRTLKVDLSSTTYPSFDGSTDTIIGVDDTLGVAHGGTGIETVVANGFLYGAGTNSMNVLAPGEPGAVLITNGQNTAPSWAAQSNLSVGSAAKLTTSRMITLAVASNANGGVTGSVSTTLDGDVTIDTTLSSHEHDAEVDITTGILPVARGGTGYGSIDATPTSGSDHVVKSSGVHKRIAYKKVTLDRTAWQGYTIAGSGQAVVRQSIQVGNDVTSDTEIVSVKLVGSMVGGTTRIADYLETTGNGSNKNFVLKYAPTGITSVLVGGLEITNYTVSGSTVVIGTAPTSGATVVINYYKDYNNGIEFSKIKEVNTHSSIIDFMAHVSASDSPKIDLVLVIGYVSETLDTISTQATIPDDNKYNST